MIERNDKCECGRMFCAYPECDYSGMRGAHDNGFELFKREPELVLAAVWRHPDCPREMAPALEFLEGYKAARRQRDEYLREKARGEPVTEIHIEEQS
jgi:hypothetical protein